MAAANDVLSLFKVTADTEEAKAPLNDLGGAFGSMFGQIAAGTAVGGAALQVFNGIIGAIQDVGAAAVGFITDSIAMNASLETTTLQFETLMGSADLAADHVKFLFEFAKNTPFETQPIIEASRQFQVFGGNLLNTERNLTLVGNAAAATSKPINEIAMWTGRLYSVLQAGRPFGEAAMRLQELAVLSPKVRAELEGMQKAGKSGAEIFARYQESLEGFNGAMEKQAKSFEGLKSTLSDTINILGAQLFEPFFEMAKAGLTTITDLLGSEGVAKAVKDFGEAGKLAFDAIGAAIGPVIRGLIDTSKEWLESADSATIAERAAQGAVHMFANLTSAAAIGLRATGEVLALLQSMAGALAPVFTFIIESFQSWNKAQLDTLSSMELFIGGMLLQLARLTDGLSKVTFGPMAASFQVASAYLRAEADSLGDSVIGRLKSNYEGFGGTLRKVASDLDVAASKMHENADKIHMFEFVGPLMKKTGADAADAAGEIAKASKEAEAAAKKLKALSDSLFGRDTILKARDYVKVLGDIGNVAKLTTDKKRELNKIVAEALAAYKALGETAPPALERILRATQDLIPITHQWAYVELKGAVEQVTPFQASIRSLGVDSVPLLSASLHHSVLGFVEFKEAIEDVNPVIEEQKKVVHDYGRELSNMIGAFGLLVEITGDDSIAQWMSELADAMGIAEHAATDLRASFEAFQDGNWASGIMTGVSGVVGAVGALDRATDRAGRGRRALSGAAAGARIGMVAGPYGALVGAAVGAIVGALRNPGFEDVMNRVGEHWGVTITEALARSINDQADALFGGNRQAAEIFNLGNILAEAGGLDEENLDVFTARLRDVFVMFAEGKFTIEQAGAVLDQNWNAFVEAGTDSNGRLSDSLLEIMRLAKETGIEVAAITQYLSDQAAIVARGFDAAAATLPVERWREISDELKRGSEELSEFDEEEADRQQAVIERRKSLMRELRKAEGDARADLIEELAELEASETQAIAKAIADRRALMEQLGVTEAMLASEAERNATALQDMGVIALAAYGAAIAAGASHLEALEAAGPGISRLREAYELLGLEVEDTFLAGLMREQQMLENNPQLIAGVNGLADSMVALHNMGRMNEETFAAMQRTGASMYERLQAAAAAVGGTTADALLPMQDYLHEAERAAADLGVPLDEATQSMIAQSRELGIWQEEGPTAAEKTQAAMEDLTKAIEDLTEALMGGGEGIDEIGERTRANQNDWHTWGDAAMAEIDRVRNGVDGISFGSSPGGIRQWRPLLLDSIGAFRQVETAGTRALAHLRREVDSIGAFGMEPIRMPAPIASPGERRMAAELSTIRDLLPSLRTNAVIAINGTIIHEGDLESVDKTIAGISLTAIERGGALSAQFRELVRSVDR